MTDTETALLRAVREAPDADFPRLVYADFLDENGQGDRAEFIRHEVTLGGCQWCDNKKSRTERLCDAAGDMDDFDCRKFRSKFREWFNFPDLRDGMFIVRRGFPDRVTLTTAQFMGGPCGRCDGGSAQVFTPGNYDQQTGVWRAHCPACHGTGQAPGLARELFERWPITGVRLSDREPMRTRAGNFIWHSRMPGPDAADELPSELFDILGHGRPLPGFQLMGYSTPESAHAALSDACVAYGRGLVGLRALPQREPQRIVVDMTGRRCMNSTEFGWIEVPHQHGGFRREPTGERTVTLTGDVRPFHGHVGKEVYLRIPGETSGPWMVLETEFFTSPLNEGRAVIRNTTNTNTEVTP